VTRRWDLDTVLLEVLQLFSSIGRSVYIDWIDLDQCSTAFDEHQHWAQCTYSSGVVCVGLHPALRGKAPKYVLTYLAAHEILHVEIPPHLGRVHHRAFNVAERLIPQYLKARKWLDEGPGAKL
jgi:hypothetical protein